jgi:AcrR family transcriptional regulator
MTKRDAILKAADEIFARHGYGLAGVDTLARVAGVTKRTLYKQFGSKEGLFIAWLGVRDLRTHQSMIAAVESMETDPKSQIFALFTVLASLSNRLDFHGCPFSRALIEFGSSEAQSASMRIAQDHKLALQAWFEGRLIAANIEPTVDLLEEIAMLYEGTLARVAITRSPQAALAARRLLQARLA